MSEFVTTGSSNVLIKGKPIRLCINVKKEDGKPFFLANRKSIYLSKMEIFKNYSPKVEFKKNGNYVGELHKHSTRSGVYYLKLRDTESYQSFQVEIQSENSFNEDLTDGHHELELEFTPDGEDNVRLKFDVVQSITPIEIKKFKPNQYLIQHNRGSLKFEYKVTGEPEDMTLSHNGLVIAEKQELKDKKEITIDQSKMGAVNQNQYFTLSIKKGTQYVSETRCIIYLSQCKTATRDITQYKLPDGGTVPITPLNLCASRDAKHLYTLFSYQENGNHQFLLGFTCHVDGHNWQYNNLKGEYKLLRYFVESPMVHHQGNDYNRLLFIGGSQIKLNNRDPEKKYANHVGVLNLDNYAFTVQQMTDDNGHALDPSWGHTCRVKNDGNIQTIYRLGGATRFGGLYDAILTSTDGVSWKKDPHPEHVDVKGIAKAATIKLGNKDTLWLSGGMERFGDEFKNKIYRLDNHKLNINDAKFEIDEKLTCFAIATYALPDANETGLVLIGFDPNGFKIAKSINCNDGYLELSNEHLARCKELLGAINIPQTGVINTAFVNGCLFFHIFHEKGGAGTGYFNDIYYHVPTVNSSTIDFFK